MLPPPVVAPPRTPVSTGTTLLIVESAAKCPKIRSFLGAGYDCIASCGHLLDLPRSIGWFNPSHPLDVPYTEIKEKKRILRDLRQRARGASRIMIASDMDREGEAIGYHVCQVLGVDPEKTERILFDQVTESAIRNAVATPSRLRVDLYRAQQARRIIDILFGFSVSPLLWCIGRGLSAGRCQSPALRWIAERQKAYTNFEAASYYDLEADLVHDATGHETGQETGEETGLETVLAKNAQRCATKASAVEHLHACQAVSTWVVHDIRDRDTHVTPPAALTTSALQQRAHSVLHLSPKTTMQLAQKLYESGRITYMRTDCTRLAAEFVAPARQLIAEQFGPAYVGAHVGSDASGAPGRPKAGGRRKKKQAHAQEAHEAIRPVDCRLGQLPSGEPRNLARLYELIYRDTLSSLMSECVRAHRKVSFVSHPPERSECEWTHTWSGMKFPGHQVWEYIVQSDAPSRAIHLEFESERPPSFEKGARYGWREYRGIQKHTTPPAPFTPSDLVRELEKRGVGRPSTYSSILARLEDRKYVCDHRWETVRHDAVTIAVTASPPSWTETLRPGKTENKAGQSSRGGRSQARLRVTDLGEKVVEFLTTHLADFIDAQFTSELEGQLDRVSKGELDAGEVVRAFHMRLTAAVNTVQSEAAGCEDRGRRATTNDRVVLRSDASGDIVAMHTRVGAAVAFLPKNSRDGGAVFVSLPKTAGIHDVTLEHAQELLARKKSGLDGELLGTVDDAPVLFKHGPHGPYVQWKQVRASVDKKSETCTLATALEILRAKKTASGIVRQVSDKISIRKRDGSLYLMQVMGKGKPRFASLGADAAIQGLSEEDCKAILQARVKKPGSKTGASKTNRKVPKGVFMKKKVKAKK